MATLFGMFPFLKTLFADSGYQGPKFANGLAKVLPHLDIEIVKRSDQVSGFVVLPKRWIVERTIAAEQPRRRTHGERERERPDGDGSAIGLAEVVDGERAVAVRVGPES